MRVRQLLWEMKSRFYIKNNTKKNLSGNACVFQSLKSSWASFFYICGYFCKEGEDWFVSKNNSSFIPIILGKDYLIMNMYQVIFLLYILAHSRMSGALNGC